MHLCTYAPSHNTCTGTHMHPHTHTHMHTHTHAHTHTCVRSYAHTQIHKHTRRRMRPPCLPPWLMEVMLRMVVVPQSRRALTMRPLPQKRRATRRRAKRMWLACLLHWRLEVRKAGWCVHVCGCVFVCGNCRSLIHSDPPLCTKVGNVSVCVYACVFACMRVCCVCLCMCRKRASTSVPGKI